MVIWPCERPRARDPLARRDFELDRRACVLLRVIALLRGIDFPRAIEVRLPRELDFFAAPRLLRVRLALLVRLRPPPLALEARVLLLLLLPRAEDFFPRLPADFPRLLIIFDLAVDVRPRVADFFRDEVVGIS